MFVATVDLSQFRRYLLPAAIAGAAVLVATQPEIAHAGPYVPGEIRAKAQPIIELMKEAAEPIAYGVFIWGFVQLMLGHKAEAKDKMKGAVYGLVGIKLLPWLFDILNSVGV